MKIIKLNMASGHFFYSRSEIRQGENLASQLEIVLSPEYIGDYVYNLKFKLNGETVYLTEPLSAVDGVITYPIKSPVTTSPGILKLELNASVIATGLLAKSAVANLKVIESIDGSGEIMPEAYVPWVTVINQAALDATEQAGLAEASAVEAARQAGLAEGHATTAGEQAGIAAGHATTASQQAGIAAGHATTASTKAGEANTSAIAAAGSAGTATAKAQIATDKAAEAVETLAGTVKKTQKVNGTALSGDITVAASAVPVTPAGGISATNVQGAIAELDGEKAGKVMATNLVTNGDFSNGVTAWTGIGGDISTVIDGKLVSNGPSATTGGRYQDIPAQTGDKLFVSFKTGAASGSLFSMRYYNYGAFSDPSYFSPSIGFNSAVISAKQNGIRLYVRTESGSTYDNAWVDDVLAINLTAIFGAGNEPSKEQMVEILKQFPDSWFDGTKEILQISQVCKMLADTLNSTVKKTQMVNTKALTGDIVINAGDIGITPTGGISATNVQAAIEELDGVVIANPSKNKGYTHPMGGAVAWTFDGGQGSLYTAAQILQERGQYATFFLQNQYLNNPSANGEVGLTSEQVLEIEQMGHEIGGHSVSHPDFDLLTEAQMVEEAEGNIDLLKAIGVKNIGGFAYPRGKYNTLSNSVLRRYFPYVRKTISLGGGLTPSINSENMGRHLVEGVAFADAAAGGGTPQYVEEWKALLRDVKNKGYVIPVYMHGFKLMSGGDINLGMELFTDICDYCKFIGLPIVTMISALKSYNLANTCDWKFENLNAWRGISNNDKYNVTLDSDIKFVGETSFKITPNNNAVGDVINIGPNINRFISIYTGQRLSVSFRLNIPTDLAGDGISLNLYGYGNATLSKILTKTIIPYTNTATNGWVTKSAEIVIPSDTPRPLYSISLDFQASFTGGEAYIDMLEVIDLDQDVLL